jgi:uncharacterized protein (DUF1778 family)
MTPKRKRARPEPEPQPADKETMTFSLRLTPAERERLDRAAQVRGWTVTNLLRVAALEKAAYILNTSTPTKLNSLGLAMGIATRLFALRAYTFGDAGPAEASIVDDLAEDLPPDVGPFVRVDPPLCRVADLELLSEAARYGGTEFLNMILDAAKSLTAPHRADLPDPIDPNAN